MEYFPYLLAALLRNRFPVDLAHKNGLSAACMWFPLRAASTLPNSEIPVNDCECAFRKCNRDKESGHAEEPGRAENSPVSSLLCACPAYDAGQVYYILTLSSRFWLTGSYREPKDNV